MLWLKQPLSYVERRYFSLVSGAQSVDIELPEVVEGRCDVKGGREVVRVASNMGQHFKKKVH
jgi:L-asparaginase II